jgi:hypothetical protein
MAFNQVTNLDFEEVRLSLKEYLRSSPTFTDYNFEGSVLSQLIDLLAYNTYYSALNANLVANEVFFDSASIRENVVSLASIVGYTPRSAKAAKAVVTLDVPLTTTISQNGTIQQINDTSISSLTLKKGAAFIGNSAEGSYVFSVLEDITRESYIDDSGRSRVTFSEIEVYQGTTLNIEYTVDTSTKQKYIIPSADADSELLNVFVDERLNSTASTTQSYKAVTNISNLSSTNRIYFIQENKNEQFELIFGDGVFGKKLNNLDVIRIEYLITDKLEGNDCRTFTFTGKLERQSGVPYTGSSTVTVNRASFGGANPEGITSIKYLAPRSYAAQNRAVTVGDYESIIKQRYANIEGLSIYGGEDASPPQYGKVFIVAKPFGADSLTVTAKQNVKDYLKEYSILNIVPEIIDPSFLYLDIQSFVYYDSRKTKNIPQVIENKVKNTIINFGTNNDLDKFNGKFKYSKLVGVIDDVDKGITSNITRVKMRKNIKFLSNIFATYKICYGNRISKNTELVSNGFKITGRPSTEIYFFERFGTTNQIAIYRTEGNEKKYFSTNVGTINYEKGEININDVNINSSLGNTGVVSISVTPASNDIISLRDLYLVIDSETVNVSVILDELASSSRSSGVGQIPVSS